MHDVSLVTGTRNPHAMSIELSELLLVGKELWRRCIYPTDGRVSAYIPVSGFGFSTTAYVVNSDLLQGYT